MLNWFKNHEKLLLKLLAIGALIAVVVIYIFSLKKDHTYEIKLMEIKAKDEKNAALQEVRASYNDLIKDKENEMAAKQYEIIAKGIEDSLVKVNTELLDSRIKQLQNLNKNNAIFKAVDTFGSSKLRDYYRDLSKYNNGQR